MKTNEIDIIKTIEEFIESDSINESYDMTSTQMKQIVKASKDTFDLCSYCFTYGYMQGMRAEKES